MFQHIKCEDGSVLDMDYYFVCRFLEEQSVTLSASNVLILRAILMI